MLLFSAQAELPLKHSTLYVIAGCFLSFNSVTPICPVKASKPICVLSFPHSLSLSLKPDTQKTVRSDLLATQKLYTEMSRSTCRIQ